MRYSTSCLRFQSFGCNPRRAPRPDGRIRHYKNIPLRSSVRIPDLCVQFYKSISSPPCKISKGPISPLKGLGEYNRQGKHCQSLFNEFTTKRVWIQKRTGCRRTLNTGRPHNTWKRTLRGHSFLRNLPHYIKVATHVCRSWSLVKTTMDSLKFVI